MKPYKTITLRLNKTEYSHLKELCDTSGLKMEPTIRKLLLAINPNTPNHEAFVAIATEIALVRFHNKGRSVGYNREDCELEAQSVSCILCRRFGIDRAKPDMSKLSELYAGWPTPDRKQALDSIQNMSKMVGRTIERNITPQQRSRPLVRRPTR